MKTLSWWLAIGLTVCLSSCGKGAGNWRASRDSYCSDLPHFHQLFESAFIEADGLAKVTDTELLVSFCSDALGALRDARGLLDGLEEAEGVLSAGAPDRTEDRAMFVNGHGVDDELRTVSATERTGLMAACRAGDHAGVARWLDTAHKAREDLFARLDLQVKECEAVGAGT
jgi:hypothetical protein